MVSIHDAMMAVYFCEAVGLIGGIILGFCAALIMRGKPDGLTVSDSAKHSKN